MSQIEWYYAKQDRPCGPVTPVELKQLVSQGGIGKQTLVWRDGMQEWIAAGKVQGLFDAEAPANPAGAVPGEAPPPTGSELPQATEPPVSAARPPSAPPAGESPKPAPQQPHPSSIEETERESPPWRHPLEALSDLARQQFDAHFVRSTTTLFQTAGQIGAIPGAVALVGLGITLGAATGTIAAVAPLGALGAIGLLISQYLARRLYPAMHEMDRAASASISSTAALDGLALSSIPLGLAALLGLAGYAFATVSIWPALLAILLFILCTFIAVVAWDVRGLRLHVAPPATAAQEAAAVVFFLGKLAWRLSAVGYGAGMVLGTLGTLHAAIQLGLSEQPDSPWLGWETAVPLGLLLLAAPLPAVGYVVFLACLSVVEICQSCPTWRNR